MLVLKDITGNRHMPTQPAPELDALLAQAGVQGVWTLPWLGRQRKPAAGPRAVIRWAIIKASETGACPIAER